MGHLVARRHPVLRAANPTGTDRGTSFSCVAIGMDTSLSMTLPDALEQASEKKASRFDANSPSSDAVPSLRKLAPVQEIAFYSVGKGRGWWNFYLAGPQSLASPRVSPIQRESLESLRDGSLFRPLTMKQGSGIHLQRFFENADPSRCRRSCFCRTAKVMEESQSRRDLVGTNGQDSHLCRWAWDGKAPHESPSHRSQHPVSRF